jgi:hypothetical protein
MGRHRERADGFEGAICQLRFIANAILGLIVRVVTYVADLPQRLRRQPCARFPVGDYRSLMILISM